MGENSDDNDPFEEDIVFDQSGLLARRSSYSRQQMNHTIIPTFMLFIRTVFLCVAFTGLGLCASVSQGPIIRLEIAVGVSSQAAFYSFTAHAVGMLIGGILGAMLFEVYNRQFLIFVSLMWMSVSISVLPFTVPVSYWWTLVNLAALGAGMSFLVTGSNVLCLDLWGKAGGASLQSLHFSFAVGAFVAPILLHPLISEAEQPQVGSLHVATSNASTAILPPFLSPQQVPRRSREAPGNVSELALMEPDRDPFGGVESLTLPTPLWTLGMDSPVPTSPEGSSRSPEVSPGPTSAMKHDQGSSKRPAPSPEAATGRPVSSKGPKPKPSFTNANLIPERSKWERPPPKGDPKANEHSILVPTTTTSTTTTPATLITSQKLDSLDSEEPESTTASSLANATFPERKPFHQSSIDASETGATSPWEDTVAAVTEQGWTVSPSSSQGEVERKKEEEKEREEEKEKEEEKKNKEEEEKKNKEEEEKKNKEEEEKKNKEEEENNKNKEEEDQHPATEEIASGGRYEIDFSNGSNPELEEDLRRQEMLEYIAESMGPTKEEEEAPPKLLDLKEAPGKEGEASTIAVTASFPGAGDAAPGGHQAKPGTFSNVTDPNERFLASLLRRFRNFGVTSIHFVYVCVGLFLMVNGCVALALMCHNPREPRSKQEDGGPHHPRAQAFIAVFALYMFSTEALQGAVHHLLASSHTGGHGFELPRGGVDGAAAFWGLVAVTRFLCILLSGCLKVLPGKILVGATSLTVAGTALLCAGTFGKPQLLWGGIVMVGLGLAPVLPTSFLFMAQQMRVTHRMCALMIVTSSFGNSLTHTSLARIPPNSHAYAFVMVGVGALSLLSLVAALGLGLRARSPKTVGVPPGYHLARQEEDETLELTRHKKDLLDAALTRRLSEMGEAGQALLID